MKSNSKTNRTKEISKKEGDSAIKNEEDYLYYPLNEMIPLQKKQKMQLFILILQ